MLKERKESNMSQFQKRNEFRKNKKSGHPAYIFAKIGDKFVYIGLTHDDVLKSGIKCIELDKNPNPDDQEKSYAKPYTETLKENKFSKQPYKNWSFSENDRKKIEKIKKRTK